MNINQTANTGKAPASVETAAIESPTAKKAVAAELKTVAVAAAAPAAAQEEVAKSGPPKEAVKKSVDAINRFLQANDQLKFSVDQDSGKQLVQLVDTQTKVVLRQFPSVEALAIAKNLDRMQGVFVNSEA